MKQGPNASHQLRATRPVQAYGYSRLSQQDDDRDKLLEERFAVRKRVIEEAAARHGLTCIEIFCEQVSGSKLANRPKMLELLELCKRGQCTHIVTQSQSRLLRGDKRDEATIEEILYDGCITVISATQGPLYFGAEDFDSLPFELNAVVDRHKLREYRANKRRANVARTLANERNGSWAPYGYRLLKPPRDTFGKIVPPTESDLARQLAYRDAAGALHWQAYATIPEEYMILEEVLRRLAEGAVIAQIQVDLNRRKVPPPGATRGACKGTVWHETTVYNIACNPFYAGYHYSRQRTSPTGKRIMVGWDEAILARQEGPWPHPVTLDQWRALRRDLARRIQPFAPRTALLSGLIRCGAGKPMRGMGGRGYQCKCWAYGDAHAGQVVSRARIDAWARDVVSAVILQLPDDALPAVQTDAADEKRSRGHLGQALRRAQKDLEEKQTELDVLIRQAATTGLRFNPSDWQRVIDQVTGERDTAKREVERIEEELARPALGELLPLVQRIRAIGLARFWEVPESLGEDEREAHERDQREVIRGVIKQIRLTLPAEGKRFYETAEVELHDWTARYALALPPFPTVKKPGLLLAGRKRDPITHRFLPD